MRRSPEGGGRHPARASLMEKTARIALALERRLGVPPRRTPAPEPLDLLIATILSQNTNDRNSHRAYTELRRRYPSWERAAAAPRSSLRSAIRSGGIANQKSRHIKETLQAVFERYGAYDLSALRVKRTDSVMEELTALRGVGVKTAACVLLFSLRRDVFPVDTHVHRLCTRLGLAPGSRNPEQTFTAMKGLVPRGKAHSLHTNLIRFGRTVCRSARPRCGVCPLYGECLYPGKHSWQRMRPEAGAATRDFMLLDNV